MSEIRKTIGRFNIIVAGRTGVGKTTLIGAIFGHEVGDTLMGRPRTRGRIWYPLSPGEADILRLCDTEGLEMDRYKETLDGLRGARSRPVTAPATPSTIFTLPGSASTSRR